MAPQTLPELLPIVHPQAQLAYCDLLESFEAKVGWDLVHHSDGVCVAVYRKSCIMFVFSYIILQEYSVVTVSIVAFQAGVQGSNPTCDKFFHDKLKKYFHKIVSCKSCIMFIFS